MVHQWFIAMMRREMFLQSLAPINERIRPGYRRFIRIAQVRRPVIAVELQIFHYYYYIRTKF